MRTVAASLLLWVACTCPPATPREAPLPPGTEGQTQQLAPEDRAQLVPTTDPDFDRVEGAGIRNQCTSDQQCFVGGCSAEMCTAVANLSSTCKSRQWPSAGGLCGCMAGLCRWYKDSRKAP